ncbi:hypothetical protein ACFVWG_25745 [Kribbella sp. NPDC058245]|uniref:hypothetical protein n=1 Tax=Kribbella sp. NPDC058245 TaxID=3346399 RepID=UPI0036E70929
MPKTRADDRVIVLGYYRGRARTTNRPYQAAFAHDLTITDDLIARLTQITDTDLGTTPA